MNGKEVPPSTGHFPLHLDLVRLASPLVFGLLEVGKGVPADWGKKGGSYSRSMVTKVVPVIGSKLYPMVDPTVE